MKYLSLQATRQYYKDFFLVLSRSKADLRFLNKEAAINSDCSHAKVGHARKILGVFRQFLEHALQLVRKPIEAVDFKHRAYMQSRGPTQPSRISRVSIRRAEVIEAGREIPFQIFKMSKFLWLM